MGNCIRHQHQPSVQWAGDDWGAVVAAANDHRTEKAKQGGMPLGGGKIGLLTSSTSAAAAASTEIKIKITKKQLEELLGKADVKELSLQQVLAHLINVKVTSSTDRCHEAHQRSWRPALQSIPEVN